MHVPGGGVPVPEAAAALVTACEHVMNNATLQQRRGMKKSSNREKERVPVAQVPAQKLPAASTEWSWEAWR